MVMTIRLSSLQDELNDIEINNRDYAASFFIQGLRGDLIVGGPERGYPALMDDVLARLADYDVPDDETLPVSLIEPIIKVLSVADPVENPKTEQIWDGLMEELLIDGSDTQKAFALLDQWRTEEIRRYQQKPKDNEAAR